MNEGHWTQMAPFWRFVGPPLRPAAEDIAAFHSAITDWQNNHDVPPRALMLGVTPELYSMKWPMHTELKALDGSRQMIDAVWPGPKASAIVGSWTEIPLANKSLDVVVCDGGFGMLRYPDKQRELLAEVRRLLVPGGIFAVRLFSPVGRTGTVIDIFEDLTAGRIASLDALKLRLWGALHGSPSAGVQPRTVVAAIRDFVGDFDHLARDHGWALAHVRALGLHLESQATYYLTEAKTVIQMACDELGSFRSLGINHPSYELGDCCPLVTLQRTE